MFIILPVVLLHTDSEELLSWTPHCHSMYSFIVMYIARVFVTPGEAMEEVRELLSLWDLNFLREIKMYMNPLVNRNYITVYLTLLNKYQWYSKKQF